MPNEWLKAMPPHIAGGVSTHRHDLQIINKINRTIKTCPGMTDHLNLGYIIPLWTDIIVFYDCFSGTIEVKCSDGVTEHHMHQRQQFDKCPVYQSISPYQHVLNLHTPWRLKLPPGYSSYICHPFWSGTDEFFTALPGIVDNDAFHTLNLILRWNKLGKGEYLLKRGTPLAQIFPFKREKFTMSISTDEAAKPDAQNENEVFGGFFRKYRSVVWKKKNFSSL